MLNGKKSGQNARLYNEDISEKSSDGREGVWLKGDLLCCL